MADTRIPPMPATGNTSTLHAVTASPAAGLPVFSTATAILELWEKACSKLSPDELEWFADGAARQVCNESRALAAVLERAGSLVSNGDSGADLFLEDGCSELFFTLHNQMTTINGLAEIAVEASQRMRQQLKGGAV